MKDDRDPGLAPRFVPHDLGWGPRLVYLGATVFFLLVFAGLVWPVYAVFATIRPFVLGMPFSLAYVVILLLAAFGVLLGLFLWEQRRGLHDPLDPPIRGSGDRPEPALRHGSDRRRDGGPGGTGEER